MGRRLVFGGIFLVLLGVVGRLFPRVVTGVSVFTVLEIAGFLALLLAAFGARGRLRALSRDREKGRYVLVLGTIALLLVLYDVVEAVIHESRAGRHYAAVERHLERDDPDAAHDLAGFLGRPETPPPLRVRILERMAALENDSGKIVRAVRGVMIADGDGAVRQQASETLGALLGPPTIVRAVRDLPELDDRSRKLLAAALRSSTGAEIGDDPTGWRDWLAERFAGEEPTEWDALAWEVFLAFPDDASLREATLGAIRRRARDDPVLLRDLLEHEEPRLRTIAARVVGGASFTWGPGGLRRALLREEDPAAADAQGEALVRLLRERAPEELLPIALSAADRAGVRTARRLLGAEPGQGAGALLAKLYREPPTRIARRDLLSEMLRRARTEEPVRTALLESIRTGIGRVGLRVRALAGLLALEDGPVTEEVFSGLLADEELARDLRSRFGDLPPAELRARLAGER